MYLFGMLRLGHILISHPVVADLFMHSLPDLILLHFVVPFYTEGVFACDISHKDDCRKPVATLCMALW